MLYCLTYTPDAYAFEWKFKFHQSSYQKNITLYAYIEVLSKKSQLYLQRLVMNLSKLEKISIIGGNIYACTE